MVDTVWWTQRGRHSVMDTSHQVKMFGCANLDIAVESVAPKYNFQLRIKSSVTGNIIQYCVPIEACTHTS